MTDAVNPLRGDVEFKIGDKTLKGRLNHGAIVAIETKMEDGIVQIAGRVTGLKGRADEICFILARLLEGHPGNDKDLKAEDLMNEGLYWDTYQEIAGAFDRAIMPPIEELLSPQDLKAFKAGKLKATAK